MHPIIEQHRSEIVALCQEFGVARLDVVGSICAEEFDPATSDIDVLVQYRDDVDLGFWLQSHLELKARLSELINRPADLIMAAQPRNPFRSMQPGGFSTRPRSSALLWDMVDHARFASSRLG